MGATFEIWLATDTGTYLDIITTWERLEYSLITHQIGTCQLVLPGSYDKTLLAPDRRLVIWRAPEGGPMRLERVYFIRQLRDETETNNNRRIHVLAYDGNYLLKGRVIPYRADSAAYPESARTDQADDFCKAVVKQNLSTGATDADRRISTGYLSIDPDFAGGASHTRTLSWRNVLTVLQEIADWARESAGDDVFWDMTPIPQSTAQALFNFQTWTKQMGVDHSYPSGTAPVLVGLEYGNMQEPSLTQDWSDEVTVVYGGGSGEANLRSLVEVEDATRSGRSVFGRREAFLDARQLDGTKLTDAAKAKLTEGRPRLRFAAKLLDSSQTRYGIHWRWGDKLTATYQGQMYNAIVKAVRVSVERDGKEEIEARLEYEE